MTRFARAQGSKASNERHPEEATSWQEMQNQLRHVQEKPQREKFEAIRQENYEKFLKESKPEEKKVSWFQFDQASELTGTSHVTDKDKKSKKEKKDKEKEKIKEKKANDSENVLAMPIKKKKVVADKKKSKSESKAEIEDDLSLKDDEYNSEKGGSSSDTQGTDSDFDEEELDKWCDEYSDEESNIKFKELTSKLENILQATDENESNLTSEESTKSKNRKKKNKSNSNENKDILPKPLSEKSKKNKNKKHKNESDANIDTSHTLKNNATVHENNTDSESISNKKLSKKQKKLEKKKKQAAMDQKEPIVTVEQDKPKNEDELKQKKSRKNKKRKMENESSNQVEVHSKKAKFDKNNADRGKNTNDQSKNTGEYARRKPQSMENTNIIVNGEEMPISQYDGFPILTKDAQRLKELRKSLISKGIPRKEVDRTMKLERRRAEKSLARIKKRLCLHCRKAGHNLNECPDLNKKSENTGMPASGICYKCGSTEHSHFACKVVRSQDFKFAQCFVCKEQGHISRQCPDNPRGIYPKGGACKECGDVTHLKKDCPKVVQQREDHTIKLDVMETDNIEDISKRNIKTNTSVPKVKHVKF